MKHSIAAFAFASLPLCSLSAATVDWTAASGLFPNQLFPAYTLIDTAAPQDPVLSSVLTLSTNTDSENMYYSMSGSDIAMPSNLVIEFTARYVSGSSSAATRAPITIGFTTQPNVGCGLHIGLDTIFLRSPN